jgi:hypothetical protein
MDFKVGDMVKKPNGKYHFKILTIRVTHKKFGDWFVENMVTGNRYNTFSDQGWVIFDPFTPKKIYKRDLRFDFKNGI